MKLVYNPEGDSKENVDQGLTIMPEDNVRKSSKLMREKMKDKPFKEKLVYYVGYYKFPVMGTLLAIGALVAIIYTIVTNKEYNFVAMLVNSVNIESEAMSQSFASYAELDTDNYRCFVDAGGTESLSGGNPAEMGASTRFAALISTSDLDVAVFNSDLFYIKACNGVFADLRDVLSPEELDRYKDRLLYVDLKEADKVQNDLDYDLKMPEVLGDLETQRSRLPRYTDPAKMQQPVPVGIIVEDAPIFTSTQAYYSMIPVYGVIVNTKRPETALRFLDYLYDPSVDTKSISTIAIE